MDESVTSTVKFLKRLPLYSIEKPFKIVFDVSAIPGAQKTNHELESHEVEFTNAQATRQDFTLLTNGFEFHKYATNLTSEDFDHAHIVRGRYYKEVVDFLKNQMADVAEFHVLSHQVRLLQVLHIKLTGGIKRRRRGCDFPTSTSYNVPTLNPILYAHTGTSLTLHASATTKYDFKVTDFTRKGADIRVQDIVSHNPHLVGRDYQMVK